MLNIIAIMAGGAIGSLLRHLIFLLVQRPAGAGFPYGTLAANLLGCLSIGFLWYLLVDSRLTQEWRLFLFTGILGGFTTFSTFARETTDLIRIGEWKTALVYVGVSNILGIGLVFVGMLLARRW
ncbi:fluoride efflux transporter CrcB [Desulfurivibrio sp. D14AmB]|uniref:fluoride efflux transporter CrcB n=1 Tax=Desulfurivibrio sp. D14AmB TaxID=3374370 RepID=UPI00376EA0CB